MTDDRRKTITIVLAFLGLFSVLFHFLMDRSSYIEEKEVLQSVVAKYIEETGCYPAMRKVSYGNPSPLEFQNIYPYLPDNFNFSEDLKYWISVDGKVWIAREEAPSLDLKEEHLFFEREMGFNYYSYLKEGKKERIRVNKIKEGELLVKGEGRGLETAPVDNTYEGYEKQGPVVDVKDKSDGILILSSIEERDSPFFPSLMARIGIGYKPEEWYKRHGFDFYGEEIIGGEYKKGENSSVLESVRILSSDNRWSRWVNVYDPLKPETCYEVIDK